jgi:hypothetical protein
MLFSSRISWCRWIWNRANQEIIIEWISQDFKYCQVWESIRGKFDMWEESSRSFGTGRTEQIDIPKPSLTIIKLLTDSIGPCCEGALSRGWPHPTCLLLCHSQMFQECQLNKGHELTETCSRLQTFYSLNPWAAPIVSLVQYCLLAIL